MKRYAISALCALIASALGTYAVLTWRETHRPFTAESCNELFVPTLKTGQWLCLYHDKNGQSAKLYENDVFVEAPSAEYQLMIPWQYQTTWIYVDHSEEAGGPIFSTPHEVAIDAMNYLKIYSDGVYGERYLLCQKQGYCRVAPDGQYITQKGVKLPLKNFHIDADAVQGEPTAAVDCYLNADDTAIE